jgi:hypothetical protein
LSGFIKLKEGATEPILLIEAGHEIGLMEIRFGGWNPEVISMICPFHKQGEKRTSHAERRLPVVHRDRDGVIVSKIQYYSRDLL